MRGEKALEMLSRLFGRGPAKSEMRQSAGSSEESDEFGRFLLSEYSNIAQAHFKTTETISAFLKHYLTIISAPIAILGIVVSIGSARGFDPSALGIVPTGVSVLFIVISFVGVSVLAYVVNLRMDAILYARTINGIRKYFYDQERRLGLAAKSKVRVLPQSPVLPRYREVSFFGPVVFIFACLNTVYLWLGSAGLAYYRFEIAEPLAHVVLPKTE